MLHLQSALNRAVSHEQGFTTKPAPLERRKALLWFRTKCLPYIMEGKGRYVNGHRFCHHVSIALGKAGQDVDVSCTDKQLGGHPLPFRWAPLSTFIPSVQVLLRLA